MMSTPIDGRTSDHVSCAQILGEGTLFDLSRNDYEVFPFLDLWLCVPGLCVSDAVLCMLVSTNEKNRFRA